MLTPPFAGWAASIPMAATHGAALAACGDAGEHVCQPSQRINIVEFRRHDLSARSAALLLRQMRHQEGSR